jgi:tryptophanyl-tRNA synthetase
MSCPAIKIVPAPFEERRCLMPAAIDQDPYWRIQRDIAESLEFYKAAAIHSRFLMSLMGPAGKMSASQPDSAVFLNDDPKTVRKKIWLAYSGGQPIVDQHRMFDGNPDVDVTFQWLYYFFEEDDNAVERLREEYRSGRILSGEMNEMLIEKVTSFLERFRDSRERAKELLSLYTHEGELEREMWSRKHGLDD